MSAHIICGNIVFPWDEIPWKEWKKSTKIFEFKISKQKFFELRKFNSYWWQYWIVTRRGRQYKNIYRVYREPPIMGSKTVTIKEFTTKQDFEEFKNFLYGQKNKQFF